MSLLALLADAATPLTVDLSGLEVVFPAGLVGLPKMRRFALVDEGRAPWLCLESMDKPRLAFTVADPSHFMRGYRPHVAPATLAAIAAKTRDDASFLVLAVEGPTGPESVNLLGPLVVNPKRCLGVQIILDPDLYPLRWPVAAVSPLSVGA